MLRERKREKSEGRKKGERGRGVEGERKILTYKVLLSHPEILK